MHYSTYYKASMLELQSIHRARIILVNRYDLNYRCKSTSVCLLAVMSGAMAVFPGSCL